MSSRLVPITNMPPFHCSALPDPYNKVCSAYQQEYPDTVKSGCQGLPGTYQAFCNALPPPDSVNPNGVTNAQSLNPNIWPNTAFQTAKAPVSRCGCYQAEGPADFAHARQVCAAVGPKNFYSCLWARTSYPPYPEFFQEPMVNRDNLPTQPSSVWPCDGAWKQLPSNVTCSSKTPVVYGMK